MEDVAGISGDAEKKRSRFLATDGVAPECYGPGSLATGPKEDGLISPRPTNQSLLDRAVETHQRFRQTVPDSCGENSYLSVFELPTSLEVLSLNDNNKLMLGGP